MTFDEERIAEIEARIMPTLDAGYYKISEADWKTMCASRLAWKFTAKCYATSEKPIQSPNKG